MPDDVRFNVAPALAPKSRSDYAFVLHCLYMLADDGVCACQSFPGIAYRGNAEGKIRKWLIDQNYIDRVVHFPGGYFADTNIATICLVLKKNKTTTDIVIYINLIKYTLKYRVEFYFQCIIILFESYIRRSK